jgi:hypothetical protein
LLLIGGRSVEQVELLGRFETESRCQASQAKHPPRARAGVEGLLGAMPAANRLQQGERVGKAQERAKGRARLPVLFVEQDAPCPLLSGSTYKVNIVVGSRLSRLFSVLAIVSWVADFLALDIMLHLELSSVGWHDHGDFAIG